MTELTKATLVALARDALARGDFSTVAIHSESLINRFPTVTGGFMLKAQGLLAQGDFDGSLEVLHRAMLLFPSDTKLLSLARTALVQYGHFTAGLRYTERLAHLSPNDPKNDVFMFFCLMGAKNFDAAACLLSRSTITQANPQLKKLKDYYKEYERLRETLPALVLAWEATLDEQSPATGGAAQGPDNEVLPVIQYWSQGAPPEDVGLVVSHWNTVLARENLGTITLFDRHSADAWIRANAPEFSDHFSKSFHVAMEADVFRLAYASKKPCIYIDIDCWPLTNTTQILKLGVRSGRSMLYFRSYRPWVVNCFFIGRPDCKFLRELVRQVISLDVDTLPKNRSAIEGAFGPSRFNSVLRNILSNEKNVHVSSVPEVSGCSLLSFGDSQIYFSHEAAVASVKPPFSLRYKSTGDNWRNYAAPT